MGAFKAALSFLSLLIEGLLHPSFFHLKLTFALLTMLLSELHSLLTATALVRGMFTLRAAGFVWLELLARFGSKALAGTLLLARRHTQLLGFVRKREVEGRVGRLALLLSLEVLDFLLEAQNVAAALVYSRLVICERLCGSLR